MPLIGFLASRTLVLLLARLRFIKFNHPVHIRINISLSFLSLFLYVFFNLISETIYQLTW